MGPLLRVAEEQAAAILFFLLLPLLEAEAVEQGHLHKQLEQMVAPVEAAQQTGQPLADLGIHHQPLHHREVMVQQDLLAVLHTIQAAAAAEPQQQGLLQLPQLQQMEVTALHHLFLAPQ
jgi:hypothetical protein